MSAFQAVHLQELEEKITERQIQHLFIRRMIFPAELTKKLEKEEIQNGYMTNRSEINNHKEWVRERKAYERWRHTTCRFPIDAERVRASNFFMSINEILTLRDMLRLHLVPIDSDGKFTWFVGKDPIEFYDKLSKRRQRRLIWWHRSRAKSFKL